MHEHPKRILIKRNFCFEKVPRRVKGSYMMYTSMQALDDRSFTLQIICIKREKPSLKSYNRVRYFLEKGHKFFASERLTFETLPRKYRTL